MMGNSFTIFLRGGQRRQTVRISSIQQIGIIGTLRERRFLLSLIVGGAVARHRILLVLLFLQVARDHGVLLGCGLESIAFGPVDDCNIFLGIVPEFPLVTMTSAQLIIVIDLNDGAATFGAEVGRQRGQRLGHFGL